MFIQKNKRPTLLQYWTTRYFITLLIGLAVIAILSAWWIRHSTIENRLNMAIFMVEELANRVSDTDDTRVLPRENAIRFPDPESRMNSVIYLVGREGKIMSTSRHAGPVFRGTIPLSILEDDQQVQRIQFESIQNRIYIIKAPININETHVGWVVTTQSEQEITKVDQEYSLLLIMIGSLALLGWAAIYFLSRKLSSPIKNVAQAAKEVQHGNYSLQLPADIKEQEVYELVHSFKEMADRLQQLEALRTELLAGVTHELKTPITSISGLLQAVKEDVVTGEEAKEFLDISLKETSRMQKMVADLLDFNSFSVNHFRVINEPQNMNKLIEEITHQ